MERMRILQSTAERYRMMAGTITDQDTARRLLDYADELKAKAAQLAASEGAAAEHHDRPTGA